MMSKYSLKLSIHLFMCYSILIGQKIVNMNGTYDLDGDNLLGNDGEGATDGSHPNDLGMVRYADAYEPVLRSILEKHPSRLPNNKIID